MNIHGYEWHVTILAMLESTHNVDHLPWAAAAEEGGAEGRRKEGLFIEVSSGSQEIVQSFFLLACSPNNTRFGRARTACIA
jgi:hypothetical protein